MKIAEEILIKCLTDHFKNGAEGYIKDHPIFMKSMTRSLDQALKPVMIEFLTWTLEEGWQQYDADDRWICQKKKNLVCTSSQLYTRFEKEKSPVASQA